MEERTAPESIRQAGPNELEILWRDGHMSVYPVSYLRRACKCAACVDEWTGERLVDPGSIDDGIKPVRIEPVGNYAIHIAWSDGHTSGIYAFDYLRRICPVERSKSDED